MSFEFLGFTIGTIGKLLIAYTAIAVHYRVRKEHKIDKRVFKTMRREQVWGILGVALIVIGYVMEVPTRFDL